MGLPSANNLVALFCEPIDRKHQRYTEEGHPKPRVDKVGQHNHHHPADHRHHLLLLLAVNEIADPHRTPDQRGEKKFCIKQVHSRGRNLPQVRCFGEFSVRQAGVCI